MKREIMAARERVDRRDPRGHLRGKRLPIKVSDN